MKSNDGLFEKLAEAGCLDSNHFNLLDKINDESLTNFFREKKYATKHIGLSSRMLNHWVEKGVLEDDRDNPRDWRTFCFTDLVWIEIVKTLLQYGFSLTEIANFAMSVFHDHVPTKPRSHIFEMYAFLAFTSRPVAILCSKRSNAPYFLSSEEEYTTFYFNNEINRDKLYSSLVQISINEVINTITNSESFRAKADKNNFKILQLLQEEHVKNLFIKIKKKSVDIDVVRTLPLNKRHSSFLSSKGNSEIKAVKRNGKVVYLEEKSKA